MVKIKVIYTMYKILQTSAKEKQAVEDPMRIGRSFFILETKLLFFLKEQEGPEPLLKFIKKKVQKSTAQRLQREA
jgi:hypothetical protein